MVEVMGKLCLAGTCWIREVSRRLMASTSRMGIHNVGIDPERKLIKNADSAASLHLLELPLHMNREDTV